MKMFFALVALLLAACAQVNISPNSSSVIDQAYVQRVDEVVLKLTSANPDIAGICSSVVIAPALVLTAEHCLLPKMQVEQNGQQWAVAAAKQIDERDLMLLAVPGIECPCAERPLAPAEVKEAAVVVGYPAGLLKGVLEGRILGRATYEEWDFEGNITISPEYLVASTHVTEGNSGGGLFVYRDGKFWLVGIVSRGHSTGIPVLAEELKAGDL